MSAYTPWTAWLLRLQVMLLIVLLAGIIGVRFELLPFRTAFSGFGLALVSMFAIAGLALIALLVGWLKRVSAWYAPAWKAFVVGVVPVLAVVAMVGPEGFKVPAIHDISTDLENPPEFVAARAERKADENTLDHEGAELAALQRGAYPDLKGLELAESPEDAFKRAEQACKDLGWRIIRADQAENVLEAVDESKVFGFKDDVIIRILPSEKGSHVDVRSVSRVGVSDLGANAKRIRRYLAALGA